MSDFQRQQAIGETGKTCGLDGIQVDCGWIFRGAQGIAGDGGSGSEALAQCETATCGGFAVGNDGNSYIFYEDYELGGWHSLKFVRIFLTSAFDVRVAHPLRHAKGGASETIMEQTGRFPSNVHFSSFVPNHQPERAPPPHLLCFLTLSHHPPALPITHFQKNSYPHPRVESHVCANKGLKGAPSRKCMQISGLAEIRLGGSSPFQAMAFATSKISLLDTVQEFALQL
jgi:hypothetical protein